MKSPTPETQCADVIFEMNTQFLLLILQMIYQGQVNITQPLKTLNN